MATPSPLATPERGLGVACRRRRLLLAPHARDGERLGEAPGGGEGRRRAARSAPRRPGSSGGARTRKRTSTPPARPRAAYLGHVYLALGLKPERARDEAHEAAPWEQRCQRSGARSGARVRRREPAGDLARGERPLLGRRSNSAGEREASEASKCGGRCGVAEGAYKLRAPPLRPRPRRQGQASASPGGRACLGDSRIRAHFLRAKTAQGHHSRDSLRVGRAS